jgi:hypothetical protein
MFKANWLESLHDDDEIHVRDLHLLVKEDLRVVFDDIFFFFFLPLTINSMLSHT